MNRLQFLLSEIIRNNTNYEVRNHLVYEAMLEAMCMGLNAGIRNPTEDEKGWLVVFIDLPGPDMQVSWHVPEYAGRWDGHTTSQKFARIAKHCSVEQMNREWWNTIIKRVEQQ